MRYFIGLSCEEYKNYNNIYYCHNDLFLIKDTLVEFCDYSLDNCYCSMIYLDADDSNSEYWYKMINKVSSKMTRYDTILFYFAGHGMVIDGDGYFLLPNSRPGKEKETALSLKKINTLLKQSKGNSFSIIDACHSGIDARDGFGSALIENLFNKSWATLAACSENECSFPDKIKEQGIFTYNISEAIKEWKKEQKITFEELKLKVGKLMDKWCKQEGKEQHPTLNASVVGIQEFAIRNSKIAPYEVTVQNEEKRELQNEIVVVNNSVPTLWAAAEGISLPKKTEMKEILSLNTQLREKEINSIYGLYKTDEFEFASETMWSRAILILRDRVLSLGVDFVGEMVGLDNHKYIQELPAFEVINLAVELGFINSTGKLRLSQANELVQHYKERDVNDEMPQNESDSVIRACIQYILGCESTEITIEFGDFRTSLKHELFEKQPNRLDMMINSPYFYKKTTIRTLINLIASTDGAEYETVSSNFSTIVEAVWDGLSSDDRYFIGITYSKYANKGEQKYIYTFKNALEKVHGFDYVPENLRSLSFIQAAKNIKQLHYEFNNFYTEPEAVMTLEKLGNQIPKPAIKESVSACIMVILGNYYGSSDDAYSPAHKVLNKLDKASWEYYINECLGYDDGVLDKIITGDRRTTQWCKLVIDYKLNNLNVNYIKMKDLLDVSSKNDRKNAKVIASYIKKKYSK